MNQKKETFFLYLYILPALFVFSVFFLLPFFSGLYVGLTSWTGLGKMKFVGLRNFIDFFTNPNAYAALGRTLWLTLIVVIIQNTFALFLAIILDRDMKGSNFFKSIFFIPSIISPVVVGYMWSFILDPARGIFASFRGLVGIENMGMINLLGNTSTAMYTIIFILLWQYIGYSMVIYIAGLSNIPKELVEASVIDGANSWQVFLHITFPLIAQALTINVLLSVIGALKIFDHVFVLTKGGPGRATEVLTLTIYNEGFGASRLGYGTAASMVLFVLILIVSLVMLKYLKKREVK
ncbi:MAG: hypothetical protein B6241_03545 [Spirochaetaceae bacterium 4572_59]|nr:MAG: hypothetical protein B6241_03545 [Spirochaetaceae bacterium 4572_59]